MRKFAAFLLILFCLAATSAAPLPEDLSKKFVGAWKLVSIEGHPPGRTNVYDRPTGLIMYDPSGHMSVNIVFKADRKPFAPYSRCQSRNRLPPPRRLSRPRSPGTDNVRWFAFQGDDRLLLIPIEDGKGGVPARKDATYKLLSERLN
jgi:hypothetical protein